MRWGTILGIIGFVIIVGNVGNTVWQDIQSGSVIVTRVCIANHYNISQGCAQADHTMSMPQAGQAYVVTNASGPANGVSDYMVVQDNSNGTTADIATWSTDVSNGHHYVVELVPQAGSLSACSARYNVRDDSSKRLTELAEPFPAKGTSTASWKFLRMFGTLQRA